LPEVFWCELEDDAKPNYPHAYVSIRDWKKIKRKDLKRTLDSIYQARSELVHQGNPLVSGHIKWTEMVPINGTGEKQKEARGGPLEKKEGQES
jgi:hypothetical protein